MRRFWAWIGASSSAGLRGRAPVRPVHLSFLFSAALFLRPAFVMLTKPLQRPSRIREHRLVDLALIEIAQTEKCAPAEGARPHRLGAQATALEKSRGVPFGAHVVHRVVSPRRREKSRARPARCRLLCLTELRDKVAKLTSFPPPIQAFGGRLQREPSDSRWNDTGSPRSRGRRRVRSEHQPFA
jgi:hypothetical protein